MRQQAPPRPAAVPARPGPVPAPAPSPAAPGPVPRQRRRSILALGVVLAGVGALAGAWAFTSFSHRADVLAAARDIPAGTRITAADLAPVPVSAGSGIKVIPARQESQAVGEIAAVSLRAGTLLVPADLTATAVPGPGQQLVPVTLKASQLPASGLAPGDQVLVVATPGAAGPGRLRFRAGCPGPGRPRRRVPGIGPGHQRRRRGRPAGRPPGRGPRWPSRTPPGRSP